MANFTVNPSSEDLPLLRKRIEAGDLTPVIDRTYPLNEIPRAIQYLQEGHTRGKNVTNLQGVSVADGVRHEAPGIVRVVMSAPAQPSRYRQESVGLPGIECG